MTTSNDRIILEMREQLVEQQNQLDRQRAQIDELRRQPTGTGLGNAPEPPGGASTTRRRLLRGGAVVVGAGLASAAVAARPVAAGHNAYPLMGDSTNGGVDTTRITSSTVNVATFWVANTSARGAIRATANGLSPTLHALAEGAGAAVEAVGTGTDSTGVSAAGTRAQVRLVPGVGDPLARADASAGEMWFDDTGDLWVCVDEVGPQWRRATGSSTAGALVAVPPVRVHDSRFTPTGPMPITGSEGSRVVSVANAQADNAEVVPAGATAITFNLTIAGSTSSGWLSVSPGDATSSSASTINWTTAGSTAANASLVRLNANREVKVFSALENLGVHFILDVTGYYL